MYTHILVAIDGSAASVPALDAACALARKCGAQLQPLYVVATPMIAFDTAVPDRSAIRDAFVQEGRSVTKEALAIMRRDGVAGEPRMIEPAHPGDDIAHCILRAAADFHADLVVMGTHGRTGVRRLVLGSVAEAFLRISQCPVLMVSERVGGQRAPNPTY
jgi:nucleotide-binding universal stress UspA family protein